MAKALLVEILGDARQFASELDRAAGRTRSFGKAATFAGVAIAGGLALGIEKSVKAALEGQTSQVALDTALRNTHQSVEAMKPALDAAEASSRRLGFTDDATRTSLARLETATGDTRKAVVDLGLAEDVARLKRTDLDTATKLITGTLAGNTRAAKQLGISIPAVTTNMDALKAKYADLGTTIPTAEAAQARFLDKQATGQATLQAVTDKVHGQAQAFADSAAGGLAQFHAQVLHLEESLGTLLLPAVAAVATALASLTAWLTANGPQISATFSGIWATVEPILVSFRDLLLAVAGVVRDHWGTIGPIIEQVGTVIQTQLAVISAVIKTFADLLRGDWRAAWEDVRNVAAAMLDAVRARLELALAPIRAGAVALGAAIWHGVEAGVTGLLGFVRGLLADVIGAITSEVGAVTAAGRAIGHGFYTGAKEAADNAIAFFRALPGRIIAALGDVSHLLYNAGASIIQGLIDGMTSKLAEVEHLASSIAGKIAGLKGPISADLKLLVPHGEAIITGLQTGMENKLGDVYGLSSGIAPSVGANMGGGGGGGGGGATVIVNVQGSVTTEGELIDNIHRGLLRTQRRNGTLGFA